MLLNYLDNGAYIPKMRSHGMVSAIEKRILELGGRIEYNTRVEKILVNGGKVTGVETAKGDSVSTSHVICNSSPTIAYNKLIHPRSEAPEIAFKTVNMRRHGGAGFVVYLGLDAPIEKIGITDYGYFISEGMDTDKIYASMGRLDVPDMQATTCLNAAIPDASPAGTTVLSMTTLFTPDVWDNVKPAEYFKLKNKIAGGMIGQFERCTGMKIRDKIEEIEVATPQTFARYTRSYKGSIYAYEQDVWDYVIPRIIAAKDEKYIDGLSFVGGYAETGSGYSPSLMSGRAAGLEVAGKL
ncbi:MAG: FAD-dependent oxidoreductase, partial [bacterium]